MDPQEVAIKNKIVSEIFMHSIENADLTGKPFPFSSQPKTIKEILRAHDDRLEAAVQILEIYSVIESLDKETPITAQEIATVYEIELDQVNEILHGNLQSDIPWVVGEQTAAGEWLWRLHPEGDASWLSDDVDGEKWRESLSNKHHRRLAAFKVLKSMGLSPRKGEIESVAEQSPAIATAMALWNTETRDVMEDGILSIIKRPAPVWAGARGFDLSYHACLERARAAKAGGLDNMDGLTQMHCYAGAGMFEAKSVLVTHTEQVVALPDLTPEERDGFLAEMELPLQPFFIDYAGSGGNRADERALPTMESHISSNGFVGELGVLIDEHNFAEDVLLLCPFFFYNPEFANGGTSCLGMIAVNQSENPTHVFHWGGEDFMFQPDSRLMVLVPTSDITDQYPEILDEYKIILMRAASTAIKMLHLLMSANVTTVPASLERRERKRAEKRGWNIAEVVYVHRSKKRYQPSGRAAEARSEATHQYDVVAHYRHFTKGPHVWCRVCKGDPLEGVCSVCDGTGLDPERVKPCSRIDESTGQPTCPNGCRREFVPSHVRGPEDAPYVPKARKFVT